MFQQIIFTMDEVEQMVPSAEEKDKEEEEVEEKEEEEADEGGEDVAGDDEEGEDDTGDEEVEDDGDDEEQDGKDDKEKEEEATPQAADKIEKSIPVPVKPKEKKQDDSLNLNNEVVKMRKEVKRVRALIIRKLTRQIGALKKKKGNEMAIERNQRRAARLLQEIHAMKVLIPDLVGLLIPSVYSICLECIISEYFLQNSTNFLQIQLSDKLLSSLPGDQDRLAEDSQL